MNNKILVMVLFIFTIISLYIYGKCTFWVDEYYCGFWSYDESEECGLLWSEHSGYPYEDQSICSEHNEPHYHPEWDRGKYKNNCGSHEGEEGWY